EGGEPIDVPRRTEFQGDVVPLHIAQLAQPLPEGLRLGRFRAYSHGETHDPGDLRWRLRLGPERRHKDGKGEGEDEPDGAESHGGVLPHTRAYSPWVRSSAHPLGDPRESGLVALEETADSIHQHGVGSSGLETAGFFERQDTLHPAIALGTDRA